MKIKEGEFLFYNFNIPKNVLYKKVPMSYLEEKLSNMLICAGILPNLKGYHYLRCAVLISMQDPKAMCKITSKLYPAIAEIYGDVPNRVERAMRHALDTASNTKKLCNLNKLFRVDVYDAQSNPTNSEFISLLADRLSILCSRYVELAEMGINLLMEEDRD